MQEANSVYEHSMKLERRMASLYVQNTGCQQCPPGCGWGPGMRGHFRLCHVLSGKGTYTAGDKQYNLRAGDTFLIYPDTTVQYGADSEDPWEYIWVGFSGMDARGYMEQTDFTWKEPVFYGRDAGPLRERMEAVRASDGTRAWERLETTARLYSLLSFLMETATGPGRSGGETPDCALTAAEYIIDHYQEPITVEGLAACASVSHSSLYRRFVKRFGVSPKRFLLEYRIGRACAMLTDTGCSIQEIANSVGFEDPFYFSRAFKEVKGVSPRQYAAQQKNGEKNEA